MKKLPIDRDSIKMVLVLTVIALIAALVLSVVYAFVYKDDETMFKEKVVDLYPSAPTEVVSTADYDNPDKTNINNACFFEDGNFGVVVTSKKAYSSSGLQLFVVFDVDGNIFSVESYSNTETAGFGSRVMEKVHLDKYIGHSAAEFNRFTDNKAEFVVEGVTGATKTSVGVNAAVTAACVFYTSEVKNG